jgi:hypothetical protein
MCSLFLVGHVLSWRERYVQNYVFAFCACGWGLVLSTKLFARKVCFYVFMFFENKPMDTLLLAYVRSHSKTDKSKRRIVGFCRKVLTDEKLPPLFFRSIFIPTHHFLCFCLFFLSVLADTVGKRCGRRLGGQFGQFIAKSPP